jgi:hypothetical protein
MGQVWSLEHHADKPAYPDTVHEHRHSWSCRRTTQAKYTKFDHKTSLYGVQLRNWKTYTGCDYIMGIRWPEIIVCFQGWSQILAATDLKTIATLTRLLEFLTRIAVILRQTQVNSCQVNCTDPTTLWRAALALMHTVNMHGLTTRQREDFFLFTTKNRDSKLRQASSKMGNRNKTAGVWSYSCIFIWYLPRLQSTELFISDHGDFIFENIDWAGFV